MAFKMKGFSPFDKTNKTGDPAKIEIPSEPRDTFAQNPIVLPQEHGDLTILQPPPLDWNNPEDREKLLEQLELQQGRLSQSGVDPNRAMAMNPIGSIGVGLGAWYDLLFGKDKEGKS